MNEVNKMRAVVVDDNPTFLGAVSRFLETDGRISLAGQASNGSDAVALVKESQPDVVILDLGMPGLTGLEVLPLMRAAAPMARVIILTFLDTQAYRQAALRAGAEAFVSKATMGTQLLPAILGEKAPGETGPARPLDAGEELIMNVGDMCAGSEPGAKWPAGF